MLFASRLENVRYIWIDSLCIIQPFGAPKKELEVKSIRDWKEQSRVMGKVYQNSYLNISATAAEDGGKGLFLPRRPENLWENEVNVNFAAIGREGGTNDDQLPRCTLTDLSFWTELVEQAPANTRGWVLQEVNMF
jgi:hypothetical protein